MKRGTFNRFSLNIELQILTVIARTNVVLLRESRESFSAKLLQIVIAFISKRIILYMSPS